jgi:hypothetical protein
VLRVVSSLPWTDQPKERKRASHPAKPVLHLPHDRDDYCDMSASRVNPSRGIAIAADMRRDVIFTRVGSCDDGTEFRSAPILWSGVAALSVGAIVLVIGGFKSMFDAAGDCSDDFCTSHALFLSGGAFVAAGIAMAIAGGVKVHRQSGDVCLRPGGISWNF